MATTSKKQRRISAYRGLRFTASYANTESRSKRRSEHPVLMKTPNVRKAIIDGQVCREGTQIEGYRVKAIYADKVIITGPGGQHTLRLFSHKVRYE